MENTQKGFVAPLVFIIITIILVTGGVYVYKNKKIEIPINTVTQTVTQSSLPSVSIRDKMQQYTDASFGFSFWYPSSWSIQESTIINTTYTKAILGGKFIKTLSLSPNDFPNDGIIVSEFISDDKSIADSSNPGPIDEAPSVKRYYFDSNKHLWMLETSFNYSNNPANSKPPIIAPANISNNTMGGLHIFYGNARHGADLIVPLSAHNFLFVEAKAPGGINLDYFANTILALDSTVATPLSQEEQDNVIIKEGLLYGVYGTSVNGMWYVDTEHVYDGVGNLIPDAIPTTFKSINYPDSTVSYFATDGVHVYSGWSKNYIVSGADPITFTPIKQEYQIPYAQSSGKSGQSFTSSDMNFSKDKSYVWYRDKLIPNADPETFVVTGNDYKSDGHIGYTLAHDAYHVYGDDSKGNITVDGVTVK